jgi:hypothetical protein
MPIDLPVTPIENTVNNNPISYIELRETQKLPPSYSQLDLNKDEIIISKQPTSTKNLVNNYNSLSDLRISGYVVNNKYGSNIVSFNTDVYNHAAFFDSTNYKDVSLYISPMVKIVNDNNIITKINLKNISSLPLSHICLSSDNQKLLLMFMNKKNTKEVYLVENSNSQQELTASDNFNKVTKLSPPLKDISSVSFNDNNNILAAGIKNGTVEVYSLSTESDANWNLDTTLTIDGIYDAIFSESGPYLYTLSHRNIFDSKQDIFEVYLKNSNFKLAGRAEDTTCYPDDIDSAHETMVFIKDKKLTIKSLISNIEVATDFENKLTIARFIPETKDILLFDNKEQLSSDKQQIYLLKCNDFEKLSYCIKDTKKLSVAVKNAYFDSNDKNNLRIIVKKTTNSDNYCFIAGASCGFILGGSLGGYTAVTLIEGVKTSLLTGFFSSAAVGGLPALLCLCSGIVAAELYDINHTKKITMQPDDSKPKFEKLPWVIKK